MSRKIIKNNTVNRVRRMHEHTNPGTLHSINECPPHVASGPAEYWADWPTCE